jgi:diphthamide biosynthesis enzyme Dph1/Dph2-like protein
MQRYSLISQLDNYKIFGIIISNTATTFHRASLQRCQDILKKSDKKVFTFMMST